MYTAMVRKKHSAHRSAKRCDALSANMESDGRCVCCYISVFSDVIVFQQGGLDMVCRISAP